MKLLIVRLKGAEYIAPGTPGKVEITVPMAPGVSTLTTYVVEILDVEAAFELRES